ncbi:MAG TPA: universal stress protein [Nitrososphaeraceae archaeon]
MLSKILVGIDGSEPSQKALEYASNLATKNNSFLYIVHVIEEFGGSMRAWEQRDSYVKELRSHSYELLKENESKAKELGVTKTFIIGEEGDAAEKILLVAKNKEVDTIVIGSRGLSTAKEFLLGSVSQKITHHAKCPVIIVR